MDHFHRQGVAKRPEHTDVDTDTDTDTIQAMLRMA